MLNGKPTGVVRASFGYASSLADADAIAAFVKQYFVQPGAEGVEDAGSAVASAPQAGAEGQMQPVQGSAVVQSLFVYPIKSCPGFQVKSWPLGESFLGGCSDVYSRSSGTLLCACSTAVIPIPPSKRGVEEGSCNKSQPRHPGCLPYLFILPLHT